MQRVTGELKAAKAIVVKEAAAAKAAAAAAAAAHAAEEEKARRAAEKAKQTAAKKPPAPPSKSPAAGRSRKSILSFELDTSPTAKPVTEQLRDALQRSSLRVLDLFREWDTDGDGEISKAEFREAMGVLGFAAAGDEIDALFDSFDTDLSGNIGFKELQKMLRGHANAAPSPAVAKLRSAGSALYYILYCSLRNIVQYDII